MKEFVCSICGKKYDELNDYMRCVSSCYDKVQKKEELEKQKKRMEEINSYIKDIKSLRHRLDVLKSEFYRKYPKEYELNFGEVTCSENKNEYNNDCDECASYDLCKSKVDVDDMRSIEVSVINDGKDKKVDAKINGEKVDYEDVLNMIRNNQDADYLTRLFHI